LTLHGKLHEAVFWLLTGLGALAACAYLWMFPPDTTRFGPVCAFYKFTGLYCPGCGSTRALYHLLHGNVAKAFRYNPFFVFFAPWLVWQYAAWGLQLIGVRSVPAFRPRSAWPLYALAIALTIFFVARNLPWRPFNMLAPGGP